ncbi:hypothetical protein HDU92_009158 [Lobulomyces angularis]|nr:hypothetical protein HDU92_009158 [Lobulomyces angularis]
MLSLKLNYKFNNRLHPFFADKLYLISNDSITSTNGFELKLKDINLNDLRQVKKDKNYFGILFNLNQIELFQKESFIQQISTKNTILGFEWTFKEEMLIVTNQGLEFFSMKETKNQFILRKSYLMLINWYIYSKEKQILVTSTVRSSSSFLSVHYLKPNSVCNQLSSLNVNDTQNQALSLNVRSPSTSSTDSKLSLHLSNEQLTRRMVNIVTLYGKTYLTVVDIVKNISPTLTLYRVTRNSIYVAAEYSFFIDNQQCDSLNNGEDFLINVSDNLLIAHHLKAKKTFIFDVKHHTNKSLMKPQSLKFPEESNGLDEYSECWRSHLPNFILSSNFNTLYTVEINIELLLNELRKELALKDTKLGYLEVELEILSFLCRRRSAEAKKTTLSLICNIIELGAEFWKDENGLSGIFDFPSRTTLTKTEVMRIIQDTFNLIHEGGVIIVSNPNVSAKVSPLNSSKIYYNTLPEKRTNKNLKSGSVSSLQGLNFKNVAYSTGGEFFVSDKSFSFGQRLLLVQQEDVSNMFNSLSERCCAYEYLVEVLLHYITSLSNFKVVIHPTIHESLVSLLIKKSEKSHGGPFTKGYNEIQQLIQIRIIEDSLEVANLLTKDIDNNVLWHTGFDMIKRIGAHKLVVQNLLRKQQVIEALNYAKSKNCLSMISALTFLDASFNDGDKTLFYTTYRCLEEFGMIFTHSGVPSPGLDRYISIFRELFGEVIDMVRIQSDE